MKTKSILNVTVAGLALLAGGSASAQPGLATAEIQALTEAPDKVQRVACVNNLKQLGIAFQIWTANNGDLGELGARARSAIPDLRQLASDDDDESMLREIARAVGAIESDTAKPVRE